MGFLNDLFDADWHKLYENIQNTVSEWQGKQPKMAPKGGHDILLDDIEGGVYGIPVEQWKARNKITSQARVAELPQAPPEAQPTQMMLDYAPYVANQEMVDKKWPEGIPQPQPDVLSLLMQYMPDDATRSALAILSESGGNPQARNTNKDGSTDLGLGQINSDTFADYQRRMGKKMSGMGINNYDEMLDPAKNIQMMKLIQQYQGWPAWYGPGNAGLDLNR